jgi:putative membrane protein
MFAMWAGHAAGPGPWFLLFPLFWLLVIGTVIFFVTRRGRWYHVRSGESALGELFARGEITEEEYRKRQRVLRERGR